MREIYTTEREIVRTQRELDDAEWEGRPTAHLEQRLKQLYVMLSIGSRGEWQTNW
jgi:hypothetical protein